MNQKYVAFLTQDFGLNQMPNDARTYYGHMAGFPVVVQYYSADACYVVTYSFHLSSEYAFEEKIKEFFRLHRKALKATYVSSSPTTLTVRIASRWKDGIAQGIRMSIQAISEELSQLGAVSGCSVCGVEGEYPFAVVNGDVYSLCENCSQQGQELAVAKIQTQGQGSYLTGLLGAILGALIGLLTYVAIGQLGYVAAITGFVMAGCAFYFYRRFGGKRSLGGVFLVIGVMLVILYFAVATDLAVWLMREESLSIYGLSFFDMLSISMQFSFHPDAFVDFWVTGYGLALLFVALGSYGIIRRQSKEMTGKEDGFMQLPLSRQ